MTETTPPASSERDDARFAADRVLQAAGVAVVPVGVLLPVAGYGVRWIAFAINPAIPAGLAPGVSIPELAAAGFEALTPAVASFLVLALIFRVMAQAISLSAPLIPIVRDLRARRKEASRSLNRRQRRSKEILKMAEAGEISSEAQIERFMAELRASAAEGDRVIRELESRDGAIEKLRVGTEAVDESIPRWMLRTFEARLPLSWMNRALGALVALGVLAWLLIATFPAFHLGLAAGLFAQYQIVRSIYRRGEFHWAAAWPAALILLLAGTVGSGINPTFGAGPARYEFASGTAADAGVYVPLGELGSLLYLQSCSDRDHVVGVTPNRVLGAELMSGPTDRFSFRPSIWSLMTGQRSVFGYWPACPAGTSSLPAMAWA